MEILDLQRLAHFLELPPAAILRQVDAGGRTLHLSAPGSAGEGASPKVRAEVISESVRWGEPGIRFVEGDEVLIGLPLMLNQRVTGGIVIEGLHLTDEDDEGLARLRVLSKRLFEWLREANQINTALLQRNFEEWESERRRAEAIHATKEIPLIEVRDLYLRLEPELFLAMRAGRRSDARRLLNQVLIGIYSFGTGDLSRIKGLLADLVSTMRRTMVECGADAGLTLDYQSSGLQSLHGIDDEEALSRWVKRIFDGLIDAVGNTAENEERIRVQLAADYVRQCCEQPLTRDLVARKVGWSPAHFSRMMRKGTGRSFTELLVRARVERSTALLRRTNHGILAIALECGFSDHSYFTKVFRKVMGQTPQQFRRVARNYQC